jgi:inner membrane protein
MIELLQSVVFWHWWVLGVGLLVLEVLAPGSFFLWLAVAAGLTGLVKLVAPGLGWEIQLVLFALLSVATLVVGRAIVKRHPIETTDSTLNRRGEQHVGRVYALAAAIENGRGTLQVGDSVWRVEGPDLPAGAQVRVIAADGAKLKVEKAG